MATYDPKKKRKKSIASRAAGAKPAGTTAASVLGRAAGGSAANKGALRQYVGLIMILY